MLNQKRRVVDEQPAIQAPLSGKCIPLEDVADSTFSHRVMGDGFAIVPNDGEVIAPFDGEVMAIFPTGHAIGLKDEQGTELLIHIGIDTVNNKGRSFETLVSIGDKVHASQKIAHFNLQALTDEGYDLTTSVVFTNKPLTVKEEMYKEVNKNEKLLLVESSNK